LVVSIKFMNSGIDLTFFDFEIGRFDGEYLLKIQDIPLDL